LSVLDTDADKCVLSSKADDILLDGNVRKGIMLMLQWLITDNYLCNSLRSAIKCCVP